MNTQIRSGFALRTSAMITIACIILSCKKYDKAINKGGWDLRGLG